MSIDQKQYIQIIGEWGYTPESLLEKIKGLTSKARDYNDRIGESVYETVGMACIFAITNDIDEAVNFRERRNSNKSSKASQILAKAINEAVQKAFMDEIKVEPEEYKLGLLNDIYEMMRNFATFEEAIIYMRQHAMDVLEMIELDKILNNSTEVGAHVFELVAKMGMAKYEKESGMPIEYYFNPIGMKAFDTLTSKFLSHRDVIMQIPSLIIPENEDLIRLIVDLFYDDLDECFDAINISIKDAQNMKPHEMYNFSRSYSHINAIFMVGVSAGIFDYADYEEMLEAREVIHNGLISAEDVESIDRLRGN